MAAKSKCTAPVSAWAQPSSSRFGRAPRWWVPDDAQMARPRRISRLIGATFGAAALTATVHDRAPAIASGLAPQSSVTFNKDVAPIVFKSCGSCHRPDGAAPFPLLTYGDVKARAAAIVAATRDRIMPPWKPEPGYGEFADARRLDDGEIGTIRRWFEAGAPEG